MENSFEKNNQNIESGDFKFDWKMWVTDLGKIPSDVAEKLDYLCDYINNSDEIEAKEIKEELKNDIMDPSAKIVPVSAMLGMMRGYLSQEERSKINAAVRDAGQNRPIRDYNMQIRAHRPE